MYSTIPLILEYQFWFISIVGFHSRASKWISRVHSNDFCSYFGYWFSVPPLFTFVKNLSQSQRRNLISIAIVVGGSQSQRRGYLRGSNQVQTCSLWVIARVPTTIAMSKHLALKMWFQTPNPITQFSIFETYFLENQKEIFEISSSSKFLIPFLLILWWLFPNFTFKS